MPDAAPLHLLLAAGPGVPGAAELLCEARAAAQGGRSVRVLLAGDGLGWAREAHRGALGGALAGARAGSPDVAVCSQQAREAGWTAAQSPAGVRWSSVATWLAEAGRAAGELWVTLP